MNKIEETRELIKMAIDELLDALERLDEEEIELELEDDDSISNDN